MLSKRESKLKKISTRQNEERLSRIKKQIDRSSLIKINIAQQEKVIGDNSDL